MTGTEQLSIQQRARLFPCRRKHGGCGARPGEFCVNRRGAKSYTVHLDRLEQENDAWHQAHGRPEADTPTAQPPPNPERDERVKLPLDPETAIKALLVVDPEDEPADQDQPGQRRQA